MTFFLSQHQGAPCQKATFRQAPRTWLLSSAENWPDESKARVALPGEDKSGSSSWAPARARGAAGARVTTGSPSRFLWLLLGCSFDLFLTGSAEKLGIALLARRWAAESNGAQLGQLLWPLEPATGRDGTPVTSCTPPVGGGQLGKGERQLIPLPRPARAHGSALFFIIIIFNHIREGCVCFFISGCCVPWGPLAAAPLFVSRKSFPNPNLAEKSSNRL